MAAHLTAYGPSAGVSFLVQPAGTQSDIAASSWVTIVWGAERWDTTSNFASNTFTAPVTGRYQFNCSLYFNVIDTTVSYYQCRMATSNRDLYMDIFDADIFPNDPVYYQKAWAVLADLDVNDTAYISLYQAGGTAQTDIVVHSTFSGFLAA